MTAPEAFPATTRSLLAYIGKKIPERLLTALPLTLVFGIGGWLLHTFLLVYANEGFNAGTWLGRNLLNVRGRLISSTLLWMLLGAAVPMLINFFRRGGKADRRIRDLFRLPQDLITKNKASQGRILPILLLTCAVTLFVESWLFSGLTSLVAGTMLATSLLACVTNRGSLFIELLRMIFRDIRQFILHKPQLALDDDTLFMTVGGAGLALGIVGLIKVVLPYQAHLFFLILYYVFQYLWVALLIAAVTLLVLRNQVHRHLLFIIGLFGTLAVLADPALSRVFADDGGWREAGGTLIGWIRSEGALPAVLSGLPPALGGLVGFYVSSILGNLTAGLTGTSLPVPATGTGPGPGQEPAPTPASQGQTTQTAGQPADPLEQERLRQEQIAREFERRRQEELIRQQEARRQAQEELNRLRSERESHDRYIQKLCGKYQTTPDKLRDAISQQMGASEREGKFWTRCIQYEKELAIAEMAAKVVLIGCDTAIDGLANCTGAVGKGIRTGYKIVKGVAGNMADKGISQEAFAGGLVKGGADAATDYLDNAWVKAGTTIAGETVGEAATDGWSGAGQGFVNGVFNAGVNAGLDKIAGKGYGSEVMGGPGRQYGMEMGDLSGLTRWRPGQGAAIEKDVSRLVAGKMVRQIRQSAIKGAGALGTEWTVKPLVGLT